MSGRIVVVGSINADVSVEVARHPGPGETVPGKTVAMLAGGKGAIRRSPRLAWEVGWPWSALSVRTPTLRSRWVG